MAKPTDDQIRASIRENAKLEVAKKLKAFVGKLREKGTLPEDFKEPTPDEYLQIADDAIGKRKVKIPGFKLGAKEEFTLTEVDNAFKTMDPDEYAKLPGSIEEMVPTNDQLEEVSGVAIRSVNKATGPLTVMGTSLFTLITSFFQAIGDLFSGKIEGGLGGFFGHVKKLAAENTGEAIGDNLQNGLSALARQNPGIGKWLTPEAIRESVRGAKRTALESAGVAPPGKTPQQQLAEMDAGKEYQRFQAGNAEAKIREGVEKDLFEVTKKEMGVDGQPTIFKMGMQFAGFAPTDKDAYRITDTVSKAVTKAITDKDYEYKGPNEILKKKLAKKEAGGEGKTTADLSKEELSELIKYETEQALKANRSNGFFTYKLTDADIGKIVDKIPGYMDKNYDSLVQMGKQVRQQGSTTGAAPSAPPVGLRDKPAPEVGDDKAQAVSKLLDAKFPILQESLTKKLNQIGQLSLRHDYQVAADDPFLKTAKERFTTLATDMIRKNPQLLAAGQEGNLAAAVSAELKKDPAFRSAAFEKLKEYKMITSDKKLADLDPKNPADAKVLQEFEKAFKPLEKEVIKEFKVFFSDKDVKKGLTEIITTAVIDKYVKEAPVGATPPGGSGMGAPADGSTPGGSELEDEASALELAQKIMGNQLVMRFADKVPSDPSKPGSPLVDNPLAEMFTSMTGLKGADRDAALREVAAKTMQSGVVGKSTEDVMFIVKDNKPAFKDPAKANDPVAAFEEAKSKIAKKLNEGVTDPKKAMMNEALAEGIAMETVNQALEAAGKAKLNPKDPKFMTAQTKVAGATLEGLIKKGLSEPETKQMINLAALGANISEEQLDAISKASAQSMAKLLASGEKDPAKIKEQLTKDLEASGAIPDQRMLKPIVDTIEQKYTATMGDGSGKPVAVDPQKAAMERAEARAKAVGQVKSTISSMVNKAVYDFGEKARAKINEQPLYVDEKKWIRGTKWFAKMIKGTQHDAMHTLVDGSVQLAKESIDQNKLTQVITDSAIAATEAQYPGPNGTTREFYQLSEQEKKDAIASQLDARLQNDATYASIFPTAVGFKGYGVPLTGFKQQVISEVVGGIKEKMNFTPAPTLPKPPTDMKIGALIPTGPNFGQGQQIAVG